MPKVLGRTLREIRCPECGETLSIYQEKGNRDYIIASHYGHNQNCPVGKLKLRIYWPMEEIEAEEIHDGDSLANG